MKGAYIVNRVTFVILVLCCWIVVARDYYVDFIKSRRLCPAYKLAIRQGDRVFINVDIAGTDSYYCAAFLKFRPMCVERYSSFSVLFKVLSINSNQVWDDYEEQCYPKFEISGNKFCFKRDGIKADTEKTIKVWMGTTIAIAKSRSLELADKRAYIKGKFRLTIKCPIPRTKALTTTRSPGDVQADVDSDTSLSVGAIVGIAVGSVAGFLLCCFFCCCYACRNSNDDGKDTGIPLNTNQTLAYPLPSTPGILEQQYPLVLPTHTVSDFAPERQELHDSTTVVHPQPSAPLDPCTPANLDLPPSYDDYMANYRSEGEPYPAVLKT